MSAAPANHPADSMTFLPPLPSDLRRRSAWSALVVGGSFDPPHLAHIRLADFAARAASCDLLIFIPAARSPHKSASPFASGSQRTEMLRLAAQSLALPWTVCDIELRPAGPSYTVDTLAALRTELGPSVALRLLLGSDQAAAFPRWKDPQRILQLAQPVVLLRGNHPLEDLNPDWRALVLPDAPRFEISSTDVRRRLAQGLSVTGLLEPAVESFIRAAGLYGASSKSVIP